MLWVGKAGTFGLMFAYPTFLLAHGHAGWQHPIEIVAWLCAVPALTLAWIAAASYIPVARGRWPGPSGPGVEPGRTGMAAG